MRANQHDPHERMPAAGHRDQGIALGMMLLAVIAAFFIVDPSLGDAGSAESQAVAAMVDAVHPSQDGAVAQVKSWIEHHATDPRTVQYHEWFNDVREGKHFTAVDCTFNVAGNNGHSHLLFQLDPNSGLIGAIMDLDSGVMIDP